MAVEKRAFRAPASGDPREVELAFARLDTKISETVDSLDEVITAKAEQIDESIATFAEVTLQVDANTASIASLQTTVSANTSSISAINSTITTINTTLNGKVSETAVSALSGLNGEQSVEDYVSNGIMDGSVFNATYGPNLNTALQNIQADIAAIASKVNTIASIITG